MVDISSPDTSMTKQVLEKLYDACEIQYRMFQHKVDINGYQGRKVIQSER